MTRRRNELSVISIPFYSDTISAVKADDGRIMVSVRRVCESLGIDDFTQSRKLQSCEWATTSKMLVVASDGKLRELTMIDHESLPMWLATIQKNKVKPEVRVLLLAFQKKAKAVLSAWFLGTSTEAPGLAAEFAEVKARLSKLERRHESTRTHLYVEMSKNQLLDEIRSEQLATLNAVLRPIGRADNDEYMTIRGYCDTYGVLDPNDGKRMRAGQMRAAGRAVASMYAALRVPVKKAPGLFGTVNAYRIDVLLAWKVSFDLRFKMESHAYRKFFGEKS